MAHPNRPIAVVGGTGMLGRPVVEALLARGVQVRVLTRSPQDLALDFPQGVSVVQGDINDRAALAQLLDGCAAVHISTRGTTLDAMWRIEVEGTKTIAGLAKAAGVERISYLSGAGIEAADRAIAPAAVKQAAEQAVRSSGLVWTILRATHFMESLDLFVRGDQNDRRIELMTPQPLAFHYLAAADYAAITARVLVDQAAPNTTLPVFGPQPFTMAEALAIYRERLDPSLAVRTAPTWLIRIIAAVTRNAELAHAAMLFKAFPQISETGSRADADALLGRPPMTLDEWCMARGA